MTIVGKEFDFWEGSSGGVHIHFKLTCHRVEINNFLKAVRS